MQDSPAADLDAITTRVLAATANEAATSSAEALFLLRQFLATGRDDVSEALGIALARGLASIDDTSPVIERAAWLMVFAEAIAIADDDRIEASARTLAAALSATWPSRDRLRDGFASVDACLRASAALASRELVPAAIDELERVVGATYRPGAGLVDAGTPARSSDHVRAASALLTAFEQTGRLPYSMLAEELMQIVRRTLARDGEFTTCCETARVLLRLAALHDTAEYRAAAVIAEGADYRGDGAHLLHEQAAQVAAASTAHAAVYGVARRELMSLR